MADPLDYELGPEWRHVGNVTVWCPRAGRWQDMPLHTRPAGSLGWQASLNGLVRFDAGSESQAIANARAWAAFRFPNPSNYALRKVLI